MTPNKNDLTPQSAKQWLLELRRATDRRSMDTSTRYKVRYMFNYITKLIEYQIPQAPVNVDDDGHKFECPRCKTAFDTDDVVDDFNLCYICGQRWKDE